MTAVLSIALPVFCVILAGVLAGRARIMREGDVGALNRFVFNFAMPAALFALSATARPSGIEAARVAASYGAGAAVALAVGYALARRAFGLSRQDAGAHAYVSTLGNAVFLGLPIAVAVPGWAETFVILMLVEGVFVIAIGAALMSPEGAPGVPRGGVVARFFVGVRDAGRRALSNPLVAAMLAGLAVAAVGAETGVALPKSAAAFLDILGRAAGPTALFSLGLFLAATPGAVQLPTGATAKIGAAIAVKLGLLPAVTLAALAATGPIDAAVLGPAALFTLVPSGVGAFVMASHYGCYQAETAATVGVTTALSVLTVTAVLVIFT